MPRPPSTTPPLPRRRFGKTGLAMPLFSMGSMRSMQSWEDQPIDRLTNASQQRLGAILEQALALGINHIETARGYGSAERQLGLLLPDLQRDAYILQTKVPPTADAAEFTHQVLDSMARLNCSYLDLLAIHGINDHRSLWYTVKKNGCLAAARRLQDQGKIGHIGFSGHGPTDVILDAVQHREDGGFEFLNLHYYYIFQAHAPVIEAARQRDMGIFIISPTDKGGHLHTPPAKLIELCRPLSPMQFNDLFCLTTPGIHTLSIGAARPEDFAHHLEIVPWLTNPLTNDTLAAIDRRLRRAMAQAIGRQRPDWVWQKLPAWDWTPGCQNLPMAIWLANLARGWELLAYARCRYRDVGQQLPWLPGARLHALEHYNYREICDELGLDQEEILQLARDAHALLTGD